MATYQLRPMSLGEILDGTLTLLRQRLGLFFGLSIICLGLPTALSFYVQFQRGSADFSLVSLADLVLRTIGYLLLQGATVYVVSESYLGRDPQFGDALGFALGKMGKIFAAGFASGIVTALAFLLLVIPGIIVACGYSVAVPVVVLEELNASTDSLGRSWSLTKGFKGKAFLLGLVMVALFLVLIIGLGILIGLATALFKPLIVPGMILVAVMMLLIYPFVTSVLTLFYYDLRVRKEAFDLELLSQSMGAAPARA